MLKETFSDVGSEGEFDQKFKLSVLTTVVNQKLYDWSDVWLIEKKLHNLLFGLFNWLLITINYIIMLW